MQDHVERPLETVVEILGIVGFGPGLVRKEIIQFEQRGWFEIDRFGDELWCRLKDGIDMPLQPGADTDHAQKEEFDPMQPAEPGSLLAKVQLVQREMDDGARPARPCGSPTDSDDSAGNGERANKATLDATGCAPILQILAGGQHLSTMEIFAALKTRGVEISTQQTYALVLSLYRTGVLYRNEVVPKGSHAAYCYWLASCSPAADEPQPAGAGPVLPQTPPSAPLVISVHLRGVELALHECGELLRELGALGFLKALPAGSGLIESHFTIKGVDLSLAELQEVAAYMADAVTHLAGGHAPYPRARRQHFRHHFPGL